MSHVTHTVHNGGVAGMLHSLALMRGHVLVGFIKGKSRPQLDEHEGQADPPPVAQVAAWNEFGTRNAAGDEVIPERPFMREGLRQGKTKFSRLNRINLLLTLRGQMSFPRALGQLGALAAGEVKRAISNSRSWAKENAPSTIAAKGSSQPLKDSGNMEQAVTWDVRA